jgi:hypothetical protein
MAQGGYRCGARVESICFINCWRRICTERGEANQSPKDDIAQTFGAIRRCGTGKDGESATVSLRKGHTGWI